MLKIFYMDIGCDCSDEQSQAFLQYLPKERQVQIEKLKNYELAKKKILAGIFLQYGISQVTGVDITQIRYGYGKQGKPYLDLNQMKCNLPFGLEFNLSHSGRYAVLAVSDKPVGIDIEKLKENRITVAKRCFHEKEYEDIMSQTDEAGRDYRFLEYWTMKEAYVKWTGDGLRLAFDSFVITHGNVGLSFTEGILEKADFHENKGFSDVMQLSGGRVWFATAPVEEGRYAVSVCSKEKDILKELLDADKNGDENSNRRIVMDIVTMDRIKSALF